MCSLAAYNQFFHSGNIDVHKVNKHYLGAELTVELVDAAEVVLRINGLVRDSVSLDSGTARLSSVVQTDYEYHECIEAVIRRSPEATSVELFASDKLLVSEDVR